MGKISSENGKGRSKFNTAFIIKTLILISAITIGVIMLTGFNQDPQLKESIKRGKEVYALNCQNCYMEDGMGLQDVNPPLAGAVYLKKPTQTLIEIFLKGQSEEIIVNGKKFSAIMPAQDYLSDEQIADVCNYVRNTWGNKIPGTITPAKVNGLRK
jgi:mono/diheme cytochrome c family protein